MTTDRPATDQPASDTPKQETGTITTRQMRRLHALLRDHGITGDVPVHDYLSVALGRPVESRATLTTTEAARVIVDLEAAPVPAAALPPGGNIAAAIAALQSELPVVGKTKTAQIPGRNGGQGYSYTYADLGDVSAAVMPLLGKHGLAFSCAPRAGERGYELAGALLHTSGEVREGALPLHGNDPQALGSAITYARRYLLGCLTGVVTDDDPDAHPAQGAARTRQWDGPSTADLLNQIDADAARAGVTYEQATEKFRQGRPLDALDALDPWVVAPLAEAVRKRADEVEAERAAREKAADSGTPGEPAPGRQVEDTALPDPTDGKDPWAAGAQA